MNHSEFLDLFRNSTMASYEHYRLDQEVARPEEVDRLPTMLPVRSEEGTAFRNESVQTTPMRYSKLIGRFPDELVEIPVKLLGNEVGKYLAVQEAKVVLGGLNLRPKIMQHAEGTSLANDVTKAALALSDLLHEADTVLLNPFSVQDLTEPTFRPDWRFESGSPLLTKHFAGRLFQGINVYHFPSVPQGAVYVYSKDNIRLFRKPFVIGWDNEADPRTILVDSAACVMPIHPEAIVKMNPTQT